MSIDLDARPERVWAALTEPEQVKQYFFGTELSTDWKVGGPIFYRGEWEGQAYEDKGTVLQVVPHRLLQHDYWSSFSGKEDLPENYQTITYELEPLGNGTRLRVSQNNLPDRESVERSEQNWAGVLDGLKKMLEKGGR
jgi:uncharacterized protein YndB with AHSA1/START domain